MCTQFLKLTPKNAIKERPDRGRQQLGTGLYKRYGKRKKYKRAFPACPPPPNNLLLFHLSCRHLSEPCFASYSIQVSNTLRKPNASVALAMAVMWLLALAMLVVLVTCGSAELPAFREAPAFRNGRACAGAPTIHIAMTLDATYLRGSLAGVLSVLRHAACPEDVTFHFLATHPRRLRRTMVSTFPSLPFHIYRFDAALVRGKISTSVRRALDQPLNYARIYLADLLPRSVRRVVYFDSDLVVVDDVARLWATELQGRVLGAPEYCHANFTSYFTDRFWADPLFPRIFENRARRPCYFNTGVMVMDLEKWREGGYTRRLEGWMGVQKRAARIYELGSLPPFLLVFAGEVTPIGHRWNQHGLGGDNVEGLCRDLHPGPVSLLHWSGKGKPWLRLDAGRPCPLDALWAPYDLLRRADDDILFFADG